MQVVCDAGNMITHMDSSMAGSANDQYGFSTSALYDEAEDEGDMWEGFLLLGDSGYVFHIYFTYSTS